MVMVPIDDPSRVTSMPKVDVGLVPMWPTAAEKSAGSVAELVAARKPWTESSVKSTLY